MPRIMHNSLEATPFAIVPTPLPKVSPPLAASEMLLAILAAVEPITAAVGVAHAVPVPAVMATVVAPAAMSESEQT